LVPDVLEVAQQNLEELRVVEPVPVGCHRGRRRHIPVEQLTGCLHPDPDDEVVALRGDAGRVIVREFGDAVEGKEALCTASLSALDRDRPSLPCDPCLGDI
jgi:hypothetical protein